MIQVRVIMFGVAVLASIGYAIYNHVKNRPQEQPYGSGTSGSARSPDHGDIPVRPPPPSTSNSSVSDTSRKRKRAMTSCSICLRNVLLSAGNTRFLDCSHGFHINCIEAWLITNKTCPNCRARVA